MTVTKVTKRMTDKNQLWPSALTVTRNVNRDLTYHNGHVPK
jgi:hypothetical protein